MKGGEILVRDLKGHESSWEHDTSMSKWITLEMRFQNNQTIDKSVQEQINKERKLERDIDERICNRKTLAKNNLTFRRQ